MGSILSPKFILNSKKLSVLDPLACWQFNCFFVMKVSGLEGFVYSITSSVIGFSHKQDLHSRHDNSMLFCVESLVTVFVFSLWLILLLQTFTSSILVSHPVTVVPHLSTLLPTVNSQTPPHTILNLNYYTNHSCIATLLSLPALEYHYILSHSLYHRVNLHK